MTSNTKQFLFRVLCGFFLGLSVIAPGISGSVMAVMMGIYHELIDIVSNPFKDFKRNFFYLLPMGIGAVISLVSFVKLLDMLFENAPIQGYLLFIGLIGGSLPVVFNEATNAGKFKTRYLFGMICAFLIAASIGLSVNIDKSAVSDDSVHLVYFAVCGLIAGASSMVPGMSISMILMMLGVYDPLLGRVASFNVMQMLPIIPVGICFVIGMVSFSRLTKFVFRRFPGLAYFMVFGFMLGSLLGIMKMTFEFDVLKGIPPQRFLLTPMDWITGILMLCAGVGISFLFVKLGEKFNVKEEEAD